MKFTIEELEELKEWINSFESDDEYWQQQPQVVLPNYSDYIIYPKQGLIWSLKSNQWVGAKNKKGYWNCHLYGDDGTKLHTTLHRVIWIAVNGDIPQGYDVNHIDENKDNNNIDNLNLMTRKENNNYGTRTERASKAKKGKTFSEEHKNNISKAKTNGITSKQVGAYKDGVLMMIFPSTNEARRNGYNQSAVSQCCRGLRQSHKGFQWHYL